MSAHTEQLTQEATDILGHIERTVMRQAPQSDAMQPDLVQARIDNTVRVFCALHGSSDLYSLRAELNRIHETLNSIDSGVTMSRRR